MADPLLMLLVAKTLFGGGGGGGQQQQAQQPQPQPHPQPAPVPYPVGIPDQPQKPARGMRKAIEVFMIDPRAAMQVPSVVGADVVVETFQQHFPRGWVAVPRVTADETTRAKALLGVWVKGRVLFDGPLSVPGRRAFVMTEHPQPAEQQQAAQQQPGADARTHAPSPAPEPSPAPVPVPVPPAPEPVAPVPKHEEHVTAVRPGEGLANVAIRLLGKQQGNVAWPELRKANIPADADGRKRKKAPDEKGGIAPMLQPGHRLHVPANWDVDPALL